MSTRMYFQRRSFAISLSKLPASRNNQIVIYIVGTVQALKSVGGVTENTMPGASSTSNGAEPLSTVAAPAPFERPDFGTQRSSQEIGGSSRCPRLINI